MESMTQPFWPEGRGNACCVSAAATHEYDFTSGSVPKRTATGPTSHRNVRPRRQVDSAARSFGSRRKDQWRDESAGYTAQPVMSRIVAWPLMLCWMLT